MPYVFHLRLGLRHRRFRPLEPPAKITADLFDDRVRDVNLHLRGDGFLNELIRLAPKLKAEIQMLLSAVTDGT